MLLNGLLPVFWPTALWPFLCGGFCGVFFFLCVCVSFFFFFCFLLFASTFFGGGGGEGGAECRVLNCTLAVVAASGGASDKDGGRDRRELGYCLSLFKVTGGPVPSSARWKPRRPVRRTGSVKCPVETSPSGKTAVCSHGHTGLGEGSDGREGGRGLLVCLLVCLFVQSFFSFGPNQYSGALAKSVSVSECSLPCGQPKPVY